jgi:hypothetical protein
MSRYISCPDAIMAGKVNVGARHTITYPNRILLSHGLNQTDSSMSIIIHRRMRELVHGNMNDDHGKTQR